LVESQVTSSLSRKPSGKGKEKKERERGWMDLAFLLEERSKGHRCPQCPRGRKEERGTSASLAQERRRFFKKKGIPEKKGKKREGS